MPHVATLAYPDPRRFAELASAIVADWPPLSARQHAELLPLLAETPAPAVAEQAAA